MSFVLNFVACRSVSADSIGYNVDPREIRFDDLAGQSKQAIGSPCDRLVQDRPDIKKFDGNDFRTGIHLRFLTIKINQVSR